LKAVRVGCSGWNYADWRGTVYPKGVPPSRWLEHYATMFDTVEINATFYRLPKREVVAGWVELDTWRRRIAAWRRETEVFVYLNNDWEGFAVRNAIYLRDHIGEARPV